MAGLLFAISAHGLGHLGQAAPVCQALYALRPDLPLTIWSELPTATLERRISIPFNHIRQACDIGLVMHDALRVNVADSWARYSAREAAWTEHLSAACRILHDTRPDLIVSDIGEMPLAAAQALGIPDVAMSSLNWADLAAYYFRDIDGVTPVLSRLAAIYDNTCLALRLTPGMPMRGHTECAVPPVAAASTQPRDRLRQRILEALGSAHQERPLVLVGLGGIDTPLPLTDWPLQTNITLLVANQCQQSATGLSERGIVNAESIQEATGLGFSDQLAACDAVICKPGYGTFAEAALAGTPVLYVKRPDWPEQTVLIEWLEAHARCKELPLIDLMRGDFQQALSALCMQPGKPRIASDGALIAARKILSLLGSSEIKA